MYSQGAVHHVVVVGGTHNYSQGPRRHQQEGQGELHEPPPGEGQAHQGMYINKRLKLKYLLECGKQISFIRASIFEDQISAGYLY